MSRAEAIAALCTLAGGLAPELAGCARLLERISPSVRGRGPQ
jgi:hypothetical protein